MLQNESSTTMLSSTLVCNGMLIFDSLISHYLPGISCEDLSTTKEKENLEIMIHERMRKQ